MSFAPGLFLSHVKGKGGLAKPSRFMVILPIPKYIGDFVEVSIFDTLINIPGDIVTEVSQSISTAFGNSESKRYSDPTISRYLGLQCDTAELPSKSLATSEVKIYGPTYKVPFQTQYTESTLGFLCTNDFYERKLFDRWMEAIMPTDTNNLRYSRDNDTRYTTNIKIIQYDDFIKQIYAVELIDAFPTAIASQPLSWSEDGFHRLSVTFSYQKYRPIYEGEYDIGTVFRTFAGRSLENAFSFANIF
jgi:hypothetical protein